MFSGRYTYSPSGGPIPLYRYRRQRSGKREERAGRVAALAERLALPRAAIEGHPGLARTDAPAAAPARQAFADPDPFREFVFANRIAAKLAIADMLGMPLARLSDEDRVSTDEQELAGQILRLKSAGAARTYEDVISGRTFHRPGLEALLDYARAGDTLAVVRLDRLGRSLRELLEVVEILKTRKIALLSLEEKIDTASAAGELVFHVFGAIAQFERRLIAERTRDGVAAARAEGRHPGRPKLDPEKLRAALTLIRDGISPTRAAAHVGLGRSTLYRELAHTLGAPP